MNKTQYSKYLKLNQADKKAFITKAINAGMDKELIHFLKFSQLATSKSVQNKMFNSLSV
jgi:hypothetical protein